MCITFVLITVGLVALYFGAEWLVRGSASLACRFHIPKLIVGLTIVAFGTSAPELVVSVKAALGSNGGIAVGNVVGSNIFNIALILGLCAMVNPLKIHIQLVRADAPILIAVSFLFLFFFRDFCVDRLEGLVLLTGLLAYLGYSIYSVGRCGVASEADFDDLLSGFSGSMLKDICFIVGGLIVLVIGADSLVSGAVMLSASFGVSEAMIGLTIVAAGTSLPELATSIVAAVRKESDIAVGNVLGSNIFNILCIMGTASLVHPLNAPEIGMIDMCFMVGVAVLLFPLMRTGFVIKRLEGALLVTVYIIYNWSLIKNLH